MKKPTHFLSLALPLTRVSRVSRLTRLITLATLSFFLITTTASSATASESVTGFFTKSQGRSYFVSALNHRTYRLKAANKDIESQLEKLTDRDLIRGEGTYSGDREIRLDSLDFVGLQNLLGSWSGDKMVLHFKSFVDVSMYVSEIGKRGASDLKYAITPGEGRDWKVFFTTKNKVSLASLEVAEELISFTFFDSQTGDKKNSVVLTRVHPR